MSKMISGFGQHHTNKEGAKHRKAYAQIDLAGIRTLVDHPTHKPKEDGQWIIPSSFPSRNHADQVANGEFWMLWADIDQVEPEQRKTLDYIDDMLRLRLIPDCDFELYSSYSASPERQKCRILVPLAKPLPGAEWVMCQRVFNERLSAYGIEPDTKSEGAGQLLFLPNHQSDYYETRTARTGQCFDPMTAWADRITQKQLEARAAADDLQRRRDEARKRQEARSHLGESSPISAFNAAFNVGDILIQSGYDQDGNRDIYRHPRSESGSFSASVKDGRVYSLSSADPLFTDGNGAHDAFSTFCVLFHGGDQSKATKDAGDNWLTINGEPWNKVKQREYMQRQNLERSKVDISEFNRSLNTHQEQAETVVAIPSATLATLPAKGNPIADLISLDPISIDELRAAKLTPRCVLKDFLYADVRTRISAGGTGKTTVAMFEAVTLALGRELWGRKPDRPCRTVIVTREDSREILVARMREIMAGMQLSQIQTAQVLFNILIIDVSGVSFRLSAVFEDVVIPYMPNIDFIAESLQEWSPDWIIFDPLVSFGVGESRVNDAEQGLIEAFRILRNRLNCCIEGIHHSGKANARDKTLDQYSGRGGSALSDGCRMVTVMQPLEPSEWLSATGIPLGEGETGIVMALAKLSYAGRQDPIYIRRNGYLFSRVMPTIRNPEQENQAIVGQVLQFITYEYSQGRRYSNSDLEGSSKKINLTRAALRAALVELKVTGRVIYHNVKGKSGAHYQPVTLADNDGDTRAEMLVIEELAA